MWGTTLGSGKEARDRGGKHFHINLPKETTPKKRLLAQTVPAQKKKVKGAEVSDLRHRQKKNSENGSIPRAEIKGGKVAAKIAPLSDPLNGGGKHRKGESKCPRKHKQARSSKDAEVSTRTGPAKCR